ncbi:MAG: FecR family protein [Tannerella sp.]|jgi:hypothetical protein|nr:FecR family protein [Tannerella sp.]
MANNNSDDLLLSLLDNELFLRWVIAPAPELDAFREQEMNENKELKKNICDLKNIINKLKIEEPALSADAKRLIWENIKQATEKTNDTNKKHRIVWVWMTAAAVLFGLLAGGVSVYLNVNKRRDIDYLSMTDNVRISQSGNISLVLSDNKVVDIPQDSSNIVYDHAGKVKINKETIESAGNEKPATLNQLIVPYGKTTSLTLSDGTKIRINSGSKLVYPSVFGKDKREIFITGEIFLDVVKMDHCPFIVKTDHIDVNVKGTQFNVSAYGDESLRSVVLVSGAVSVEGKALNGKYDVHANQMLSYETGTSRIDVSEVDVDRYISWKHGYLFFQRERIDRVLQKLEKYFNVPFAYKGEGFEKIYVYGKLDLTGSLENVLNYISIITSVNYIIHDDHVEIVNE